MEMTKLPFDMEILDRHIEQATGSFETVGLEQVTNQISLYKYLASAQSATALIDRTATLLRRAGFNDFSHAIIDSKESSQDTVGTGNRKLNKIYYEEQYYFHDLMLHHAVRSTKPILQTQIIDFIQHSPVDNEMFERSLQLYGIMNGFNIYEHYNIPFHSSSGCKVLFSVGVEGPDVIAARQLVVKYNAALHVLAEALDHIGSTRFPDSFHKNVSPNALPSLSGPPLRLLKTIVEHNCTIREAAALMRISERTAHQYSAAAKAALNASSVAAAVAQAIRLRLIIIER